LETINKIKAMTKAAPQWRRGLIWKKVDKLVKVKEISVVIWMEPETNNQPVPAMKPPTTG